jgi:hypothetical protein
MEKEILFKYAENESGNIIHINNASKGESYYCPDCKDVLIFKKGNIRQKHFSHKNISSNCTGEGYLHKTFKKMLLEILNNYLNNNLPLIINFKCNVCNSEHTGNLIHEIMEVKDEYILENCRPDIALINKNSKVPIIIEIVVTHEPENNVIEMCKKYNIILVRIKLDTINDLENIENKIKLPTNVVYFNQMNCPNILQQYIYQQRLKQRINPQILTINNRPIQRGPTIEQMEANKRRQHYAIQNYYKKKSRKK